MNLVGVKMEKKYLLWSALIVVLAATVVSIFVVYIYHPKGMESLRWLTDEEKDKVIEIALNTPEAIEMSEEYGVNKTGISWVGIVWLGNHASELWGLDYEMVTKIPDNVPETAEFYSQVEIYFGEPERVLMRVAINPDTGKVAHIETHGLKKLP